MISSVFSSCAKTETIELDDYPSLVGCYQWSYSIDKDEIYPSSSDQNTYNIIIDERGYVFTYKNNNPYATYEVISYSRGIITSIKNNCSFTFTRNNDLNTLQSNNFPYENKQNFYYKIY